MKDRIKDLIIKLIDEIIWGKCERLNRQVKQMQQKREPCGNILIISFAQILSLIAAIIQVSATGSPFLSSQGIKIVIILLFLIFWFRVDDGGDIR